MKTHMFGAKSLSCCSACALRRTASDNVTGADSDTVNAVRRNIYVVDLYLSCPTKQEGVRLLSQLPQLLVSGGFRLTKIMSNNESILSDCPAEELAASVDLPCDKLHLHKTLEIYWDDTNDQLGVKVNIKRKPCTRCGLLSMVRQTYDSLRVLQPFILPARQLLQRACFS